MDPPRPEIALESRKGAGRRDGSHESRPTSGNREGRAVLEAAVDRMTRALPIADDELIPELVAERIAMREELEELRPNCRFLPFRRR